MRCVCFFDSNVDNCERELGCSSHINLGFVVIFIGLPLLESFGVFNCCVNTLLVRFSFSFACPPIQTRSQE